jgi:hypothetical protein
MYAESRSSEESATTFHLIKKVAEAVTTSKTEPQTTVGSLKGSGGFHSRKIKAALMGRIRRMCVYCSSWRARAKVEISGDHQIAREIKRRIKKRARDNKLKLDSWSGALSTM